jgi:hypothetical protein
MIHGICHNFEQMVVQKDNEFALQPGSFCNQELWVGFVWGYAQK